MTRDESSMKAQFLAAYDEQLRTDAETPGAINVTAYGPLRLVTFMNGRGLVTYKDFADADEAAIRRLVPEAIAHFQVDPEVNRVEWKTRGHDRAPRLHEALLENGFIPREQESIMIGEAQRLALDVPLPGGVTLRRVTEESDLRAMTAMQAEVFGEPDADEMAEALIRLVSAGDGMEVWVAENENRIVTAGTLEPVQGTDFAGIWGGSTREEWRGRGIYRALTAARARSALSLGKTLIHSDSTEYSRPILERSGLLKVSTTTPYLWKR